MKKTSEIDFNEDGVSSFYVTENSYGTYSALSNNCTTFVVDMINKAGSNPFKTSTL